MIAVGVFAKPPYPGLVKTRLIPDIGAAKAASVYRYCLEYTLQVVRESGLEYQLFLSEACDDVLFQQEEHSLQKGDDLGQRMYHAFQELLDTASDGALIIGTDCLDLTPMHLHDAARSLADHELVLIPALDGGYALIGCTTIAPGLFRDLRWSTDKVYRQTVANAQGLNYRVSSLETLRDIDTLQDLEHYPELLALIASS
ncbi:MAG: glycosyltransferase [Gammaproteobacteria bacterium]|nr:glycosyltransferase [Gammaproteobacteria bacterium]